MASTATTINEALVDQRVCEALRHILPVLNAFSYVIEEDDKINGDSVYVPLATDPTVCDKTAGTFVTATGGVAGTKVTFNKFRGAGWDAVESTLSSRMLPQYWADKAAGAVYGVAKDVVDTALALITASNYGNTSADKYVVAPADFNQQHLANVWAAGSAKVKRQNRLFMMGTSLAAALFGSSNLALIYANAGNNFLESGKLPKFLSLDQMHYEDFPDNSEKLIGAIIGKAALAVAIARPGFFLKSGDGDIIDRRVITDADSGLSCMYTTKAGAGGTLSGEVALLFGVAKGQNSVVRVVKS